MSKRARHTLPKVFAAIASSVVAASVASCSSPEATGGGDDDIGGQRGSTMSFVDVDAETLARLKAMPAIPMEECNKLCTEPAGQLTSCMVYPPPGGGPEKIGCTWETVFYRRGRLPRGVEAQAPSSRDPGACFAHAAYLEHASVHAFGLLVKDLRALGAPSSLVARCRAARRDELSHTRIMRGLSQRAGVEPLVAPATDRPRASLFDLAMENAVEGCVLETFAALLSIVDARTATSPSLRRRLARIADDECRHARLSWDIAAWAEPMLALEERRAVEEARARTLDALIEATDRLAERDDPTLATLARSLETVLARPTGDVALALAA
ncbi:MAG: ferritin-like domain-containing protein [Polyangiaceae bacterium]|nr:ferritin-like domain-containing protein [Polyangiaceae bacterium]